MEVTPRKIDVGKLHKSIVSKWNSDLLDEGFVPFPKRLLRCMSELFGGGSGIEQLAAILAVVDYKSARLARPPSAKFLAVVAGLTEESLKNRFKEMERKNWMDVHRTPDGLEIFLNGFFEKILEKTRDEVAPPG